MSHIPVLLKETLQYLQPGPGKKYIDATFGKGGHARMLLENGSQVLGIDKDPAVVQRLNSELKMQNSKCKIVQGSFEKIKEIAEEAGFTEVDGILFDLGLGSHQLDDSTRGFSFQKNGPLDMRFDEGAKIRTAADLLNFFSGKELVRIFREFGEEKRFGPRIARAVLARRKDKKIETTADFFELIKAAIPGKFRFRAGDTARRIFQALRIAVNEELRNLELALPAALELLKSGGRMAIISFHSLEDRIAKNFFVLQAKDCICPPEFPVCRCAAKAHLRILNKKPIRPTEEEIKINRRASSAKLRVAEKI